MALLYIETLLLLAFSSVAWAWAPHYPPSYPHPPKCSSGEAEDGWNLAEFTSLVAFGDSYTDDSRLGYFSSHNGSAPPPGWVDPANYAAADGGRPWPQYVAQYSGAKIYNYAVSGAVCSNEITPRWYSGISADFPDVAGYEVPAYLADKAYTNENGSLFLDIPVEETVYSMWIGTNDLGNNAFVDDSQVAGKTIVDYVDCVYDQISRLYDSGARYFVLQNNAPLQLTAQYGVSGQDGVMEARKFWPEKDVNDTRVSGRMLEQVVTVNDVFDYRTPFEVLVKRSWPGVRIAVMDVYTLMTDIHDNPSDYLNGTAPLHVTGYIHHCNVNGTDCVDESDPDSYLWYDPLHPSEQTERIIARTFVDVVKGGSKWATYWSG